VSARRTLVGLMTGVSLFGGFQAAFAQDPNTTFAGDESVAAATAGPLDRSVRSAPVQVEFLGGTEDGTASLGLNLTRLLAPTQSRSTLRTDSFSLIVSTPVNDDEEAEFATLNGLANGTAFTLRWETFSLGVRTSRRPRAAREIEAEAQRRCETKVRADFTSQRIGAEQQVAGLARCANYPSGSNNLVGDHFREALGRYHELLIPRAAWSLGIEGSVGRNGFEFVDPATLAEMQQTRTQWSGKITFSRYAVSRPVSWTLSAGYERAYESADEQTFCPPNPNNVVITCTTAAGGPPQLNESLLLSAGARIQFMRNGRPLGLAIAPLVTYDALDDVVGVDLPVYFVPNSEDDLTGGVRFGYRSDRDDEFSVGIFIGKAFQL
jgi:hypothetical protein